MRLGQLARKLGVRPAEIAEFLSNENIQVEAGSNTRIEDDLVLIVTNKFAPDQVGAIKADLIHEESVVFEEPIVSQPVTEIQQEAGQVVSGIASEGVEPVAIVATGIAVSEPVSVSEPEPLFLEGEVIRAPKVELPGLKVLGKIEIPESKKKEVQPLADLIEPPKAEEPKVEVNLTNDDASKKLSTYEKEKKKQQDKIREQRRRKDDRFRRNPIEVKREREAEELKKRKAEEAKQEKERRTLNYKKKVKVITPVKSKNTDGSNTKKKTAKEEAPTSLWGRFKKWLKS